METLIKRNYPQPRFWKLPVNIHNFMSVILSESTLFSGTLSFFRGNQEQYGVWWGTLITKLKLSMQKDLIQIYRPEDGCFWKIGEGIAFLILSKTLYFLLFKKFSKMFKAQEKIKLQAKENVLPCENGIRINTVNQCEHFK